MTKLLIGSNNKGKIREIADALFGLNFEVISLADAGIAEIAYETGKTFAENALQKAKFYAQKSQLLTISDDSGLCVNALNGWPGIYSARFISGSDAQRNQALLGRMQKLTQAERTAYYVCVIALVSPQTDLAKTFEGICHGNILTSPIGTNGFGYDPIFQPKGYAQSFGQIALEVKQQISHRAKAIAKLKNFLIHADSI